MITKLLAQINIDPTEIDIPKTAATDDRVADILQVVFASLGSIAFLVIVIAGLQYVLSRGDAEKAARSRNTIIYAAVGIVIAMLAFAIVRFVTERAG